MTTSENEAAAIINALLKHDPNIIARIKKLRKQGVSQDKITETCLGAIKKLQHYIDKSD